MYIAIPIYYTGICGSAFTALNEEIDFEDNDDKKTVKCNSEGNKKTNSKEDSSNFDSTDKMESNVQGISSIVMFANVVTSVFNEGNKQYVNAMSIHLFT